MQTTYPKLSVRKGREWQIAHGHPWLFSGAISQAPKVDPGTIVDLVDTDGRFVARGYYNPLCDIAVRVLTRDSAEDVDREFLKRRVREARELRQRTLDENATNVYRLVNAEADFLPGFIVDYLAGVVVVQSHTAGADRLLPELVAALQDTIESITAIVVRNDAGVRKREGLELEEPRVVAGAVGDCVVVKENDLNFVTNPLHGQKTGFFTDQRDKRVALQRYCKDLPGRARMLNCFSYTGSFSVYAKVACKHIATIDVDQSQRALDEARENFRLNGIDADSCELICAEAFEWLETAGTNSLLFDIVVLDPPAFAKSQKDTQRALKAYKRLGRLGLDLLRPGGILVTCSCSGPISLDQFRDCLKDAAGESGRRVQILEVFQNGVDHPVNLAAAETSYLKVLFCRVF